VKPAYTNGTDRWLTPPDLIEALGPFDLDPCCEPWMPWRTAGTMLALPPLQTNRGTMDSILPGHEGFTRDFQPSEIRDGLKADWYNARVWMNHPYSMGLPWAEKMARHGRGIALTAAKSTDTRWGQIMLANCTVALFLAGRILFRYPDGSRSAGKWLPNVLWAFGEKDASILLELTSRTKYRGTYMRRLV